MKDSDIYRLAAQLLQRNSEAVIDGWRPTCPERIIANPRDALCCCLAIDAIAGSPYVYSEATNTFRSYFNIDWEHDIDALCEPDYWFGTSNPHKIKEVDKEWCDHQLERLIALDFMYHIAKDNEELAHLSNVFGAIDVTMAQCIGDKK